MVYPPQIQHIINIIIPADTVGSGFDFDWVCRDYEIADYDRGPFELRDFYSDLLKDMWF